MFVEIGGKILPTRANKFTVEALENGFKTDDPKKYNGKKVTAVHQSIGTNEFLVWKPSKTLD